MFCGHSLGIIFKLLCAKLFFFRTLHFLEKSVERDEVLHELSLYIGTYVKQTISFGYFRSVYVLFVLTWAILFVMCSLSRTMSRPALLFSLLLLISCTRGGELLDEKSLMGQSRADSVLLRDSAAWADTVLLPEPFVCVRYDFRSPKEQGDSLVAFMKRSRLSSPDARRVWEQRFFCAFPGSFEDMQLLFGYDSEKGPAPLYSSGEKVIEFFSELRSIPDSLYYLKYIKICLDGIWQADNIRDAFGLHQRLLDDTENVCRILSGFQDPEIVSVFRFFFDGPHPAHKHYSELFKLLMIRLDAQGGRYSTLLSQAYNEILAQDDGHGK